MPSVKGFVCDEEKAVCLVLRRFLEADFYLYEVIIGDLVFPWRASVQGTNY